MKWVIKYLKAQNYVRVTSEGLFSIDENSRLFEEILSQEYWKPGMGLLLDNRKVDFSGVDFKMVRQAGSNYEKIADRIGNSRTAMLMKSVSDFGRGRQFELTSENKGTAEMCVFLDEKEALDWVCNKST